MATVKTAELAKQVAELTERVAKLEAEAEDRRVDRALTWAMTVERAPPPPKS